MRKLSKKLYPKTTQLIYSQYSERIDKKYNEWVKRQPKRSAKVDVYDEVINEYNRHQRFMQIKNINVPSQLVQDMKNAASKGCEYYFLPGVEKGVDSFFGIDGDILELVLDREGFTVDHRKSNDLIPCMTIYWKYKNNF